MASWSTSNCVVCVRSRHYRQRRSIPRSLLLDQLKSLLLPELWGVEATACGDNGRGGVAISIFSVDEAIGQPRCVEKSVIVNGMMFKLEDFLKILAVI